MNELTRDELDAIKARLDGATPGSWVIRQEGGDITAIDSLDGQTVLAGVWSFATDSLQPLEVQPADAELITHAPTDVARLLAEVERQGAQIDHLLGQNKRLQVSHNCLERIRRTVDSVQLSDESVAECVERLQTENATLKKQAVEPWNNRLPEKPGEYRIINTKTGEQQNTVFFWENSILRNKLLCIVKDVWAGTSKHFSASELLEQGYFFSYLPMSFADESYPSHPTAHSEQLTSETIVTAMQTWTDEQRMDVLREFCRHCGDKDPYCQCWNDE